MSVNDMRDYLLPLNTHNEDKRYVLNFCKKLEYLDDLRQQAAAKVHNPIEAGYGDVNSKICFVFRDKQHMKAVKKTLQEHLDEFNLNFWDVWVTFVDKCSTDYSDKYTYLSYEINAINPTVVYVFDDDESIAQSLEKSINLVGCPNLRHYFFIDTNVFSRDDAKKALWPRFRFLINYQTLDIKE